ncbi:hypothetical protein AsAng_0021120 [Aureispira anguillae]|uniref:Uncharacterized protein n=1 Tax=Aureispira anguillae TaxID=2864201 RepID=A0A915YE26_9BACT|nr:hypothetical protein AsAng_0021120 [Aureispira anguillae]
MIVNLTHHQFCFASYLFKCNAKTTSSTNRIFPFYFSSF